MTREERYVKEHCKNCIHRNEPFCDIRTFVHNKEIITKCVYYERKELSVCMKNNCNGCKRKAVCDKQEEKYARKHSNAKNT